MKLCVTLKILLSVYLHQLGFGKFSTPHGFRKASVPSTSLLAENSCYALYPVTMLQQSLYLPLYCLH